MTKLRNRNKTKRRHHVTKRRSHRHRTRSQRGGLFGYFENGTPVAAGSSEQPSYWSGLSNWFTGPTVSENDGITQKIQDNINTLDSKVGDAATTAKNVIIDEASALTENAKNLISGEEKDTDNTLIGTPYPTPSPSPPSPIPVTGGKSRKYKNKKGGANLGLLYYATPIKGGKKHKYTCCKGKGKRHKHNASCSRK